MLRLPALRLLAACLVVSWIVGCGSGDSGGTGKPTTGTGTTGGAKGSKKRIVFLINLPDPYWEALDKGLKAGAKQCELEAAGYTVSQDPNDGTPEGQISKLRQ